jgi:aminopeptidase-like protein
MYMIDALEHNLIPVNNFKGEIFCARYGMDIGVYTNLEDNKAPFNIMYLIDGTRSIANIASASGLSFEVARKIIDELHHRGLVEYL